MAQTPLKTIRLDKQDTHLQEVWTTRTFTFDPVHHFLYKSKMYHSELPYHQRMVVTKVVEWPDFLSSTVDEMYDSPAARCAFCVVGEFREQVETKLPDAGNLSKATYKPKEEHARWVIRSKNIKDHAATVALFKACIDPEAKKAADAKKAEEAKKAAEAKKQHDEKHHHHHDEKHHGEKKHHDDKKHAEAKK